MTKTLEAMSEAIRDPKHTIRQLDSRPRKSQKHRYERRKVNEVLRLTDWAAEH